VGTMADFVGNGECSFAAERALNILPRVKRAVRIPNRRGTTIVELVPYRQNPRAGRIGWIAEIGGEDVDAAINDAHDHTAPATGRSERSRVAVDMIGVNFLARRELRGEDIARYSADRTAKRLPSVAPSYQHPRRFALRPEPFSVSDRLCGPVHRPGWAQDQINTGRSEPACYVIHVVHSDWCAAAGS